MAQYVSAIVLLRGRQRDFAHTKATILPPIVILLVFLLMGTVVLPVAKSGLICEPSHLLNLSIVKCHSTTPFNTNHCSTMKDNDGFSAFSVV